MSVRGAPPPLAADVAVVAALPLEVGYLVDRLSRVRRYAGPGHTVVEGEHAGKVVAVLAGGAGRPAARRSAELLLGGHRPRWVVSAGFAGALDPSLRRNDALLTSEVVEPDGPRLTIDVRVPPPDGPDDPRRPRLLTGRLVTVDTVVRTAAEKADLRARTGADVVDMETSAVAALCAERGVTFLGVRIVSDAASDEIPPEAVTLMNRQGSYLVGSALRAVWLRPSCLKELLALHNRAQEAADRLADVTLGVVARLGA